MMRRTLLVSFACALLGLSVAADAAPPRIAFTGGAGWLRSPDNVQYWANSPEARLAVSNHGNHSFYNLAVQWQNLMAGAFLATPEGVVLGSSRDGSDLTTQLSVPPNENQEWTLHPNVNGPYRFAVISDTANSEAGQRTFGELAKKMSAQHVQFALHLGNAVTDGNVHQMQIFRDQLKSFSFPTYVVPGSAEAQNGGRKAWDGLFGQVPLSFRVDRDHFLLLDDADGHVGKQQRTWIDQELSRAGAAHARHIFVFMHVPVVDPRPGINHGMESLREVRWLLAEFQRFHVETVFAGHIHVYARETRHGVDYVTTGGGGQSLYGTPRQGGFHHFVRVDVNGASVSLTPVTVE